MKSDHFFSHAIFGTFLGSAILRHFPGPCTITVQNGHFLMRLNNCIVELHINESTSDANQFSSQNINNGTLSWTNTNILFHLRLFYINYLFQEITMVSQNRVKQHVKSHLKNSIKAGTKLHHDFLTKQILLINKNFDFMIFIALNYFVMVWNTIYLQYQWCHSTIKKGSILTRIFLEEF